MKEPIHRTFAGLPASMKTETLPSDHSFFNAWGPPRMGMGYRGLDDSIVTAAHGPVWFHGLASRTCAIHSLGPASATKPSDQGAGTDRHSTPTTR